MGDNDQRHRLARPNIGNAVADGLSDIMATTSVVLTQPAIIARFTKQSEDGTDTSRQHVQCAAIRADYGMQALSHESS